MPVPPDVVDLELDSRAQPVSEGGCASPRHPLNGDEMLARICTRALLMCGGRIEDDGDVVAVPAGYLRDP